MDGVAKKARVRAHERVAIAGDPSVKYIGPDPPAVRKGVVQCRVCFVLDRAVRELSGGSTSWLCSTEQEDLVHNLETALTSPGLPADIANVILNLAEFMEHDDKNLNIDAKLLADYVSEE